MDSNRIGAIAEHAIAAELVQLGFDVLWPLVEGRYDLAVDLDGRLIRVQCKSAPVRGDVVVVRARTNRRAPEGFRHGTYSADEVDVIAAYAPTLKRCFAVPIQTFGESGSLYLRLSHPRNGQRAGLHFAEDYPLGAVAQLERASGWVVGAHEFRNRFGWYMERAAAGEEIVVTRRGKPHLRLSAVAPALDLAA
ncbi:MAG: type II toxin-antitoxin system prevent-host-death family antitoxin [Actinobacteria bacterium]|nr:MAG: type II toxin-antitoxin system prevent-host-death family antitoxin [Actinomycetota bacterium]